MDIRRLKKDDFNYLFLENMGTIKKTIAGATLMLIAGTAFAATQTIGTGLNLSGNTATGSDTVTVTATVAPQMTMDVTNTSINFGQLTLGTTNTGSTTSTVSITSNALSASVTATYLPLTHTDTSTTIPFVINNGGNILTGGNVINQTSPSDTTVSTTVSYVATPAAGQKSGSYSTSVVYSATATF